ncbi:hypothetical protein ROA7745_00588 [Roseovarius aestuarii]|uniref:Uncharacterized protein n=2 Tax=Roseovarius aestuarii TaxID=475083 RepID=A0A1X7BME4_9RHOB|nr:hypothetical protein ROA7745_00588 [Roseovarius aestuarii]
MVAMALLAVIGCDAPGPAFRHADVTRIRIDQSVFAVRVLDLRAQAIRLNAEPAPRLAAVAPRGVMAIEKASGCRVRRLEGDAAVMQAWLDCGGQLKPLPRDVEFECQIDVVYDSIADLSCAPI